MDKKHNSAKKRKKHKKRSAEQSVEALEKEVSEADDKHENNVARKHAEIVKVEKKQFDRLG